MSLLEGDLKYLNLLWLKALPPRIVLFFISRSSLQYTTLSSNPLRIWIEMTSCSATTTLWTCVLPTRPHFNQSLLLFDSFIKRLIPHMTLELFLSGLSVSLTRELRLECFDDLTTVCELWHTVLCFE